MARVGVRLGREHARTLVWGQARSRIRGIGLDYVELRDYQPGDDIRYVDWRATARRVTVEGDYRLVVRVFEDERKKSTILVLDNSVSMRLWRKSLAAAYAASLIALTALAHEDLLVIAYWEGERLYTSYPRRPDEALAVIERAYCSEPLGKVGLVDAVKRLPIPRRAVVVVVTDYANTTRELEELARASMARDAAIMLVLVYAYPEVEPPRVNAVLALVDPETGRLSMVDMRRYYVHARKHVIRLKTMARNMFNAYAEVNASDPRGDIVKLLRSYTMCRAGLPA